MVRPNAHRARIGCVSGLCAQLLNKTIIEPGSGPAYIDGPEPSSAILEEGAATSPLVGIHHTDKRKVIQLEDNKCPDDKAEDGWQYWLPVGGWQTGDCILEATGDVQILHHKDTKFEELLYFIEVGWGRNLTLIGNFTMNCIGCMCDDTPDTSRSGTAADRSKSKGTRGITSKGAAVTIDGILKMSGFCAPIEDDLIHMDDDEGERYLDGKDGGTILARRFSTTPRSKVIISNSKARKGSGGAIAAGWLKSEGELRIVNSTALNDGGGVAVKQRTFTEKAIEYTWHVQCEDDAKMSPVTGLSLDNTGNLLATATECCPAKVFDMNTGFVLWTRDSKAPSPEHQCRPEILEWRPRLRSKQEGGGTSNNGGVAQAQGVQYLAIARTVGMTLWSGKLTEGQKPTSLQMEELGSAKFEVDKDTNTTDWKVFFRWSVHGNLVAYAYGPYLAIYDVADPKTPKKLFFNDNRDKLVGGLDWSQIQHSILAVAVDTELSFVFFDEETKSFKQSKACPYLGDHAEHKLLHITGIEFRTTSDAGAGRDGLGALTLAGSIKDDKELGLYTKVGYLLLVNWDVKVKDPVTKCPKFEHQLQRTFANDEITAMAWDPRTPEEQSKEDSNSEVEAAVDSAPNDKEAPGRHLFAWADFRMDKDTGEKKAKVRGGFGNKFVTSWRVTALRWHQTPESKRKRMILGTELGDVLVIKGPKDASVYGDEEKSKERKVRLQLVGSGTFTNTIAQEGTGGAIYMGAFGDVKVATKVKNVALVNVTGLVQGCGIQTRDGEVELEDVRVENAKCLLGSKLVIALESFDTATVKNIAFTQKEGTIVYSRRPGKLQAKAVEADGKSSEQPKAQPWQDISHDELCNKDHNVQEITCPLGQIAKSEALALDTCVVKCKSCDDGDIFSPGKPGDSKRECVKCPFGLLCSKNADLRHPERGNLVQEPVVVDDKECAEFLADHSDKDEEKDAQVTASYFFNWTSHSPVCTKLTCPEGNYGMKRDSGCEKCSGKGEITRDDRACFQVTLELANITSSTVGPTSIELHGYVTPGEVSTDTFHITCKLCEKFDAGIYAWLPLWFFNREKHQDKCLDPVEAKRVPIHAGPSNFSAHFHSLKHGFVYQPTCSLTTDWEGQKEHEYNEDKISIVKSKWSIPLTFADNDKPMCFLTLLVSAILNWITYDTKANWRRRRGVVATSFIILLGCLFAGCMAVFKKSEEEQDIPEEPGPFAFLSCGMYQHIVAVAGLSSVVTLYFITEYRTSFMARELLLKNQVMEALSLIQEVQFPMVLCRADIFLGLGELKKHEDLREEHLIKFLDTVQETKDFFVDGKGEKEGNFGIFFSHQWTSHSNPDPQGLQYQAMCKALDQLAKGRDLQKIWVWVDYFSIPQENPHTQRLAINSLPIYASSLQAFVVVAPVVQHQDTKIECNRESYQSRGWCRAEQMCHYVMRGTEDMYLAENGVCTPLKGCLKPANIGSDDNSESELELWFRKMMFVFEDSCQYTCCRMTHVLKGKTMKCDREALMLPMLGLYGKIYRSKNDEKTKGIYQLIKNNREEIFPDTFVFMGPTPKENEPQRKLFEDVMDKLERTIDEEMGDRKRIHL
mmetsp:Transcript_23991/g.52215  ORF Transcript_23991/g.52215 Transcript_23991/m.52215 type:complete len:1590 (+) Transcript_23991:176-4945(+)